MAMYQSDVLRIRMRRAAEGNAPSGPRRDARPGCWKASPGDPPAQRRSSLLSPSPWQSECGGMIEQQVGFFFFATGLKSEDGKDDRKKIRTALVSKVSIALMCDLTSYATGLKSRKIFSASSMMALFFRTER